MSNFVNSLLRVITSVLPGTCALCAKPARDGLCASCFSQHCMHTRLRCISCALPLTESDSYCGACLSRPRAFDETLCVCDYDAPFDQLVLSLKFRHHLALASLMGRLLAQRVKSLNYLPDAIVPVPLSKERLSERGFNQALEIARPVARLINRPLLSRTLVRTKNTARQMHLSRAAREDNMRGAFFCDPHRLPEITGRHLALVDDVMTSGYTAQAAAVTLIGAGAARVSLWVFARTAD